MKKVLVINGNPKQQSYCAELAKRYVDASSDVHQVQLISLSRLQFEADLSDGYDQPQALESPLIDVQQALLWAEHVVIVLPVWWGGMPAKLKGLIDRTFLPGFAFKYRENHPIPEKLLQGRTADIILTMDTPPFYYRWFQGNPVFKQLKYTILKFSGFSRVSATYIGPVRGATDKQKAKWVEQVGRLAKRR
ncbi:NAD(P)H-dependent oxidoreductase [Shewanella mangrovi]|uniref:NAD(P)H-dependent oxidoreductase n=1 Tax=Shewanella mangrovi TaxID=1515746 RepID=UPI000B030A6C|nr:NAD(P)H-dependent oxidoreductase [Shewanella mangrovi]